jgi:hypothetical protein
MTAHLRANAGMLRIPANWLLRRCGDNGGLPLHGLTAIWVSSLPLLGIMDAGCGVLSCLFPNGFLATGGDPFR